MNGTLGAPRGLAVHDLTVGYHRDVHILQEVTLEAAPAAVTALIGPNGAGKSTLLKTIFGFLRPQRGAITLAGEDLRGVPPYAMLARGVAFVVQERGVIPNLSVQENLELATWNFRHSQERVRRSIDAVYARYPFLAERRKLNAANLSGGQQRLLEIGKTLMHEPRLILLDEPIAGLAPIVAAEIYAEITRIKESGAIVLLVEQNIRRALDFADQVYLLELGRIAFAGPPAELSLRDAAVPWLRR